jgi:hypothetical protein
MSMRNARKSTVSLSHVCLNVKGEEAVRAPVSTVIVSATAPALLENTNPMPSAVTGCTSFQSAAWISFAS